jgi:type VI secretion system protein ImpG
MSDELLPYYDRELAILRSLAAEFAERHPKVAARLSLGRDESRDPHVERLLQGFAFLAADVQKRLDDDFPELTDGLLDLLYPHFLRPVPSMAIVELGLDPKQAALTSGYLVPRGTELETEEVEGDRCTYRTCFDVRLWPLVLRQARLSGPPFQIPVVAPPGTEAVLLLTLETLSSEVRIGQMPLGKLRLHLHAEAGQSIFRLYEVLLTRCAGVVISDGAGGNVSVLPRERLVAAGLEPDDAALPREARGFSGYRLLTEFFTLPQKYLFVDLEGLDQSVIGGLGSTLQIAVLLSATSEDLERIVSPRTVRLGCTPVVNLFKQAFDPLLVDGSRSEYCLTPDARRPRGVEVHSVETVHVREPGGESAAVLPFYRLRGPDAGSEAATRHLRWMARRRMHREPRPDGVIDAASDVWITLVDEQAGPAAVSECTIHASGLATNRNLPARLPFAVGRPRLTFRDGHGPVGSLTCLSRPTSTLRHRPGRGTAWRLVSHLSLNHLSLVEGADGQGALALREMLRLYLLDDLEDFDQKQRWIQGITQVSSRRVAARVGGGQGGICQGLEVRLELEEERFDDHAGYLFSSILERFIAAWVNVNAFTRLVSTSRQRESRREQWRWPPRSGAKVLA